MSIDERSRPTTGVGPELPPMEQHEALGSTGLSSNGNFPAVREHLNPSALGVALMREHRLALLADDPYGIQSALFHLVGSRAALWNIRATQDEAKNKDATPRTVLSITCEPGVTPRLIEPKNPALYNRITTSPLGLAAGLTPMQAANVYASAASALHGNRVDGVTFNWILHELCSKLGEWVPAADGQRTLLAPTPDIISEALAYLDGARFGTDYKDLPFITKQQVNWVDEVFPKSRKESVKNQIGQLAAYFKALVAQETNPELVQVAQVRPLLPPTQIRRGTPITTVINVQTNHSNLRRDLEIDLLLRILECIATEEKTPWPRPDVLAITGADLMPAQRLGQLALSAAGKHIQLALGATRILDEMRGIFSGSGFGIGQHGRTLSEQLLGVLPFDLVPRMMSESFAIDAGETGGRSQGIDEVYNRFQIVDQGNGSGVGTGHQLDGHVTKTAQVDYGDHAAYKGQELGGITSNQIVAVPSARAGGGVAGRYDRKSGKYLSDFPDPRPESAEKEVKTRMNDLNKRHGDMVTTVRASHGGDPDPENPKSAAPVQLGKSDNLEDPHPDAGARRQNILINYARRRPKYADWDILKFCKVLYLLDMQDRKFPEDSTFEEWREHNGLSWDDVYR